jgi:hypothetical protein
VPGPQAIDDQRYWQAQADFLSLAWNPQADSEIFGAFGKVPEYRSFAGSLAGLL